MTPQEYETHRKLLAVLSCAENLIRTLPPKLGRFASESRFLLAGAIKNAKTSLTDETKGGQMTDHKTITLIEVPAAILDSCSPSVRARRAIEYRIVHQLIMDLISAGFTLWINHNGEEDHHISVTGTVESMAEMFACDEENLHVELSGNAGEPLITSGQGVKMRGSFGWVVLIYGNDGYDVIHDNSSNLDPYLKSVKEFANTFA